MKRLPYSLLSLSAIFVLLVLVSCTKKPESPAEGVLGGKMLARIPATSVFFFATNTSLPAFKELKESPSYAVGARLPGAFEEAVSAMEESAASPDSRALLDTLKKSGLVPASGSTEDSFEETVLFGDTTEGKLNIGIYASSKSAKGFSDALASLVTGLRSLNVETSEETFQKVKGFKLRLKDPELSRIFEYAYAATDGERIVFATSRSLVDNLFADSPSGLAQLKSQPAFQDVLKGLPPLSRSFTFAYIDSQKFLDALATMPGGAEATAEARSVPVRAAAFTGSFDEVPTGDVSIAVKSGEGANKELLDALKSRSSQPLFRKLPSDLLLFAGFDASLLTKAGSAAEVSGHPEEAKQLQMNQEKISELGNMAIGLRMNDRQSPFPELIVAAEDRKPEASIAQIEETVSSLLTAFGMPSTPWGEKEIEGVKAKFWNSPLGIGIFAAASDGVLFVTTSEAALGDVQKTSRGKGKPLSGVVNKKFSEEVEKTQPPVLLFADFRKLGDLAETTQGTLSAFTGGASQIDRKQIDDMRRMGALAVAFSWGDPCVKIHAELLTPPK